METGSPPGTDRQGRRADDAERTRRTEFAARLVRWQQVDDNLADLMGVAHGCAAGSWPRQPSSVPLDLRENEWVMYEAADVHLVEIDRVPGVPATGYTGYSALQAASLDDRTAGAAPEPWRALESGLLTITNQRVVFHGTSRQEWSFKALLRIEHSPTRPLTLVHVTDRRWVSGLEYTPSQAPYLRFMLTLATVYHAGALDGFLAQLEAEHERHGAMRPVPPRAEEPEEPLTSLARARALLLAGVGWWRGQPLVWRAGESVAVFALLVAVTMSLGSSSGAPSDGGRVGAQPIPAPPSEAVTDAPTVGATVTAGPATTSALPTASTSATPTPTTTPTRTVDLCGAPTNPYGYNFCGHGHVLTQWPSDVCSFFTCSSDFGNKSGYLVECGDGTLSSAGGRPAACARHHGVANTVYSGP